MMEIRSLAGESWPRLAAAFTAVARAGRPLRIMNLDDRATGIAAFLDAVGARRFVRQLEMLRVA